MFFFYFMHVELFLVLTLVVLGYLLQLLLQPQQFELILEDISALKVFNLSNLCNVLAFLETSATFVKISCENQVNYCVETRMSKIL